MATCTLLGQASTPLLSGYIFFMIQAIELLVKHDHNPSRFHSNSVYKHAGSLLDELYRRGLEQYKENCPTLAPFLDTTIQRTKITARLIIYQFISTMRPFAYDAREKPRNWETNNELQ